MLDNGESFAKPKYFPDKMWLSSLLRKKIFVGLSEFDKKKMSTANLFLLLRLWIEKIPANHRVERKVTQVICDFKFVLINESWEKVAKLLCGRQNVYRILIHSAHVISSWELFIQLFCYPLLYYCLHFVWWKQSGMESTWLTFNAQLVSHQKYQTIH